MSWGKKKWENPRSVISKASKGPPHDSEDYEKVAEISEGLLSNNKHHCAEIDIIPGGIKYANMGHMFWSLTRGGSWLILVMTRWQHALPEY